MLSMQPAAASVFLHRREERRLDMPCPSQQSPWAQRLEEVRTLRAAGQDDQVRHHLEAAADALPAESMAGARGESGQPEPDPHTLMVLGSGAIELGSPAPALRLFRHALALLEREASPSPMQLSNAHHGIGHALIDLDQPAVAIGHLEASCRLRAGVDEAALPAASTKSLLAFALGRTGGAARAVPLYEEVLALWDASFGPGDVRVARTLANLGAMVDLQGDAARALACYLRSINLHLAAGRVAEETTWVTACNALKLALREGRHPVVDVLCDLLVSLGRQAPPAAADRIAGHLLDAVEAAWLAHDPVLVERLAQQGLAIARSGEVPMPLQRKLRRWLGNAHRLKGNLKASEEQLLLLMAMPGRSDAEQIEDWIELGRLASHDASAASSTALTAYGEALTLLRRQAAPEPRAMASVLGNLGHQYFETDRLAEAEQHWREAMQRLDGDRDAPDRPWIEHGLGLVLWRAKRSDEAVALLRSARRRWMREGVRPLFVATADATLALAQWDAGDHAGAARTFGRVERTRSAGLVRRLTTGSDADRREAAVAGLQDLYLTMSLHFESGVAGRLAAEMLMSRKGAVQRALVVSRACGAPPADPDLQRLVDIGRRISVQVVARQCYREPVDEAAIEALQREADALVRSLGHRSGLADQTGGLPTVAAVRAALPAGGVLVDYVRWLPHEPWMREPGPPRYAALVLPRRGPLRWFDLGPAAAIETAVQSLSRQLADDRLPDVGPDLVNLGALILQPLIGLLATARSVVIAPDGALNLVPFVLLGDPPLGERFALRQISGGADLLMPSARHEAGTGEVVAVVAPDFADGAPPEGPVNFRDLPGLHAEGEALRAAWPGATVLDGARASVDALLGLQRPALLHLATHGYFRPPAQRTPVLDSRVIDTGRGLMFFESSGPSAFDDPMRHAGLALAGANGGAQGIVTAADVALFDLSGTELVVLSACNTGQGRSAQGEDFSGLRRALVLAGSRSQLTSLWPIDDEASACLMRSFYGALSDGAGRAEALQRARQAVRQQPAWRHPSFWAPFVLWGDGSPLPAAMLGRPSVVAGDR